jgi:type III secretory pathway component EscV
MGTRLRRIESREVRLAFDMLVTVLVALRWSSTAFMGLARRMVVAIDLLVGMPVVVRVFFALVVSGFGVSAARRRCTTRRRRRAAARRQGQRGSDEQQREGMSM